MKFKYIALLFFCWMQLNAIAQYQLPAFQKYKLKNGLTVYLMEQKEVPIINVSMLFPAGAIHDGKQAGLSSLTANALMHGTQKMKKEEMDEKLDFLAARINTSSSKEFTTLSAQFASKDKETLLDIISQIAKTPAFDVNAFERDKKRLLISLEQRKESPSGMINAYFEKALFGNHVYGNIPSGTVTTVTPLGIKDVEAFYAQHYFPAGSAIAVVGDFKTAVMKKLIDKFFGNWKSSVKAKSVEATQLQPIAKTKVLLVNKDDARETTFYIGGFGVSRDNEDRVAIDVVNTYFGGRFTSMLNDELRVNSGLTYGARSTFNSYKNGGTFFISTFTATKTTKEAMDMAINVLKRLHEKGLDENALNSSKNYIKGQFPPKYETSGQLASLLTSMFWYGYDASFINNFEKNVDGLTSEKVKSIIKHYFPLEKLQIVMIGKASEIRAYAETLGDVEVVEIKQDIQ